MTPLIGERGRDKDKDHRVKDKGQAADGCDPGQVPRPLGKRSSHRVTGPGRIPRWSALHSRRQREPVGVPW